MPPTAGIPRDSLTTFSSPARWLTLLLCALHAILSPAMSATPGSHRDLAHLMAQPQNWAAQAGNYQNWRHSQLQQINRDNVSRLALAWTFQLDVRGGYEGGPLVIDGTLYLHTPYPNRVVAIDLADQTVKWRYQAPPDQHTPTVLCCGKVNRGLAYGDGLVLLQQTDTTLVALDAQTGKPRWQVVNGDVSLGQTATGAPHVFDHYVLTGIAGGEYGVRGTITAYDLETGHLVWRGYSTGPDASMLIDPQRSMTWTDGHLAPVGRDSSLKSWSDAKWQYGGGTTWGWFSYDPELRLVYYGSGNPSSWNPLPRPGDNKWAMSLWARDIDTGLVRWVYQMTPHDQWDYDGVNESLLFDGKDGSGRQRKMLAHFDRNGFAYTLDRASGELLSAEKFDSSVNWATGVDMRSGRPRLNAGLAPQERGEDETIEGICPPAIGSKNQAPAAYAPEARLFLVPGNHLCMDYEVFDVAYSPGQPYTGGAISMHPVPGATDTLGRFIAWDAIKGRVVWSRPEPYPVWSGALTTATGLVFYGTLDAHLKALDVRTGKSLWVSPRLPSGVVGNVISWSYKGRQYIGVYAGIGGLASDPDGIRKLLDGQEFRPGGELMVFALP